MRIKGVSCAVPANRVRSEDFVSKFGRESVDKIVVNIGVKERRHVCKRGCTSDLAVAAAERLLEETNCARESIAAIIFVTQTPDYLTPATSGMLQHRLGLSKRVITMDVNHGCTGFTDGLILAQSLLKGLELEKVLLLTGDTMSKMVSFEDQGTALLFGDAAAATLLETSDDPFHYVAGRDGSEALVLVQNIGYRLGLNPRDPLPPPDNVALQMDGLKVFGFTIDCVPKMVDEILKKTGWSRETADYFICHQANAFMLKKLARMAKIPDEKFPFGIENFGNTSSASIPLTMITELSGRLKESTKIALFGFGVGLAWAAVALEWKDGILCPLVEVDC